MKRFRKMRLRDAYPVLVFIALFCITLNLRWRTLYDFCFKFADSDQYVLWDAANDMHHGIFHEPCFYGQAYNPLFEPLLAQPFLWMGMPLQIAMPLTSGILGFLPYVLLAFACFLKKKYIGGAFAFALLMWLPVQFHVITSIPRGYLPSCAFAAIGVYQALFTENRFRFFWFSFLSFIAIVCNANAAFLIFPAEAYLLFDHYKHKRFNTQTIAGFLAALPLPVFIYWFYHKHPGYNLHHLRFGFGFKTMIETISHTDKYFNYLTPAESYKLITLLAICAFFSCICFIKKNITAGISIAAAMVFFMLSLGFQKSQDAEGSIFFSGVRMFLGLPVSFILFAYWAESSFQPTLWYKRTETGVLTTLLAAGIICSMERNRTFREELYNNNRKADALIDEWVDDTKMFSDRIADLCKNNHSKLVVFDNWMVEVSYYCPAMNYPITTMIPSYERRTWIMQAEGTIIRPNFIYLPNDTLKMQRSLPTGIQIKKINKDPAAFLVETNGRKVFDILRDMKVPVREYGYIKQN